MKKSTARIALLILAFGLTGLIFSALTGCNTVKGAGRDLEAIGEAGQDAIDG